MVEFSLVASLSQEGVNQSLPSGIRVAGTGAKQVVDAGGEFGSGFAVGDSAGDAANQSASIAGQIKYD